MNNDKQLIGNKYKALHITNVNFITKLSLFTSVFKGISSNYSRVIKTYKLFIQ